jgi:type VI secretion system protein ImpJ
MFLVPQHFQTQDQFFHEALQFRFTASHFANWGVTRLSIDAEALANGLLRVNECAGVMPDGEPFDMPQTDATPPSRSIKEFFPPSLEALDVYLALPEYRPYSRNVTIPGANGDQTSVPATRYLAETRTALDDNLGQEEKKIQVARRAFRLLFANEYRGGFSAFRIAQVIRNSAGVPVLNPRFVAPCLDLSSSEHLMMLVRRQIEILTTKSSSLSGPRRERVKGLADFSASETANFWLLHTVNSHLPELKHVWKVRHGHPEALYVAMLRLAGALSTFSTEAHPGDLPDYDHDDIGGCFGLLDARIRELMETVIPQNYVAVPLELVDRFIWSGTIADDEYFRNSQFFLAVSAQMGVDDIIRKVPQLVKVASRDEVPRLVRHSLPGLTLRHAAAPPSAIPVKFDNQYFTLNQSGPLWEGIRQARNLAAFAPSEIAEPKMELLIVLP